MVGAYSRASLLPRQRGSIVFSGSDKALQVFCRMSVRCIKPGSTAMTGATTQTVHPSIRCPVQQDILRQAVSS